MKKKEIEEKFHKNVAYLERNIPPDDIYLFAEQTFMSAQYFLHRLTDHMDINEECKKDPIMCKWTKNILGLLKCQMNDMDIEVDLNIMSVEEE